MIRNQARHERDWYGILRTPAPTTVRPSRAETREDAPPQGSALDALVALQDHFTPEQQLLEQVLSLEACASQYEDLAAAAEAVAALGRLQARIPVDLRGHAVTTCLFLAADRAEDDTWPALRQRRESARGALRQLRSVAPQELVWEIDELLQTGKWNTARRFPRTADEA